MPTYYSNPIIDTETMERQTPPKPTAEDIQKLILEAQALPITIGSDPEFIINNPITHTKIPASDIILDPNRTEIFGLDGCSTTGEIRPPYTTDPIKHAQVIGKIIKSGLKHNPRLNTLEIKTSSPNQSIGGHIHLGHPTLLQYPSIQTALYYGNYTHDINDTNSTIINKISKQNKTNTLNVVTGLDYLLTLPTLYTEVKMDSISRRGGSYGHISDYRYQEWGIEYRALPSWIATKESTESVLCLAYAIAIDAIKHNKIYSKALIKTSGFSYAFNNAYLELLEPHLYQAIKEIKKLTLYHKYQKQINTLIKASINKTPILSTEIKIGWKIPHHIIKQITLLSASELIEQLSTIISIRNDDVCLKSFIEWQSEDEGCGDIAYNLNKSLSSIIKTSEPENKKVYVYGKAEDKGNIIELTYPTNLIEAKKSHRLTKLIQEVCKATGYADIPEIKLKPQNKFKYRNTDVQPENIFMKIGLGLPIRKHNSYTAEMIIFVCLLFVNNSIYQAYKINEKTGKQITLPLIASTLIKPIKTILSTQKKHN